MSGETLSFPCIPAKQSKRSLCVAVLPAKIIAEISYAAIWRKSDEDGAVQRPLDAARIKSLSEFALKGGDYPACIAMNWVSKDNPLTVANGLLSFKLGSRLAQLVDGQHRIEGLREAMKLDTKVGEIEIPVSVYQGLTTQECADIFLSINDKQKPIPRSMVVDLYGVASDLVVDPISQRSRDLAELLNIESNSPYYSLIRFANEPRSKFGIAVSTVVDNIKQLVEPKGLLPQLGIDKLNTQKDLLFNFFGVLKAWYGRRWDDKKNVFLSSAGYVGAMEFLKFRLLPYCNLSRDFSFASMKTAMRLDSESLIEKEAISSMQGRASWNKIQELLTDRFLPTKDIAPPKL